MEGMPEQIEEEAEVVQPVESRGVEAIGKQRFVVAQQRKGRAGKTVTLIRAAIGTEEQEELLVYLKRRCGCGGTLREGAIELQGDRRTQVQTLLTALGHSVQLGN